MPHWHTRRPPSAQNVATTDDLLTPPCLLEALGALRETKEGGYRLGSDPFTLDPCASRKQPWPTAQEMWTIREDGLSRAWHGEVWLNPPYGRSLYHWVARLADHGSGLALMYARTDTEGFRAHVWDRASALFFLTGRPWFHQPVTGEQCPANCGGPMVLAAYGDASLARVRRLLADDSPYPGTLVPIPRTREKGGR